MNLKEAYDELGLSYYDAKYLSLKEIERVYKKLARQYHPDMNVNAPQYLQELAEQKFKKINEAMSLIRQYHEKEQELIKQAEQRHREEAERRRQAEQRRQEELKKQAEQRRKEELKRQAEQKRQEELRRRAEKRRKAKVKRQAKQKNEKRKSVLEEESTFKEKNSLNFYEISSKFFLKYGKAIILLLGFSFLWFLGEYTD
jgi:curved DNA-binding protein CbpA